MSADADDAGDDLQAGWGAVIDAEQLADDDGEDLQVGWGDVVDAEMGVEDEGIGWDYVFAAEVDTESAPDDDGSDLQVALLAGDDHAAVALVEHGRGPAASLASVMERLPSAVLGDLVSFGFCAAMLSRLPLDTRVGHNHNHLFDQKSFQIADSLAGMKHVRSLKSIAEDTETQAQKVHRTKLRLAAASVLYSRSALVKMLDTLTDAALRCGGECICFTSRVRYDETPMPVRETSAEDPDRVERQALALAGCASKLLDSPKDKASAKLVQHEWSGAALVKVHGCFRLISFSLPVWVSLVDSCCAELYSHLNKVVEPPVDRIASRFSRQQRLVTTDGDGSIAKAERIMEKTSPSLSVLHNKCGMHKVALIPKKFTKQMATDISWLIHLALSLRIPGGMKKFRKILRELLVERLVILQGYPGHVSDTHRTAALDLFCPAIVECPETIMARTTCDVLANGNYRNVVQFEHYERGCCRDRQDTEDKLCTLLTNCLARMQCPVFPTSRWTHADRTLRWLGLLHCMHGLLPVAYERWAAAYGTRKADIGLGNAGADEIPALEDDGIAVVADAGLPDDDVAAINMDAGEAKDPQDRAHEFRAKHQNHRKGGLAFTSHPHAQARLVMLTQVVQPQQQLMYASLRMSGHDWDIEQGGKAALAEQCGISTAREVRSLIAWQCVNELAFMKRLHRLLSGCEAWRCMPMAGHMRSHLVIAFQLVACAGCACHELLVAPQRGYPLKTFAAAAGLDGLTMVNTLGDKKQRCLLDPWSLSIADKYAGRLDSEEALVDVCTTAKLFLWDTAEIEAKHATIRRRLVLASTQTHVQHVTLASADFVISEVRKEVESWQTLMQAQEHSPCQPSDHEEAPAPEQQQATRGGGSWRAFVHEQSQGQKAYFRSLAARYRVLSGDEKARLRVVGAEATLRHRDNLDSFGIDNEKVDRAVRKRQRSALHAEMRSHARSEILRPLKENLAADEDEELAVVPAFGPAFFAVVPKQWGSYDEVLQYINTQMRHANTYKRAYKAEVEGAIKEWVASHSVDCDGGDRWPEGMWDRSISEAQLVPAPCHHPAVQHWQWHMKDSLGVCKKILSANGKMPVGKQLHSFLDHDWECKHTMHCKGDHPELHESGPVSNPCHVAGICLCSGAGKALRFFITKLLSWSKEVFQPKSEMRHELAAGWFAFMMHGVDEVARDTPPGDGAEGEGAAAGEHMLFAHVGMHYLKPYRPTFLLMTYKDTIGDVTNCEATDIYQTLYELLAKCMLSLTWRLRIFRLHSTAEAVAAFEPGKQCYKEVMHDILAFPFWNGPEDEARGRRRKWKGDVAADDAGAEDDGDDDGEGGAAGSDEDIDDGEDISESDASAGIADFDVFENSEREGDDEGDDVRDDEVPPPLPPPLAAPGPEPRADRPPPGAARGNTIVVELPGGRSGIGLPPRGSEHFAWTRGTTQMAGHAGGKGQQPEVRAALARAGRLAS